MSRRIRQLVADATVTGRKLQIVDGTLGAASRLLARLLDVALADEHLMQLRQVGDIVYLDASPRLLVLLRALTAITGEEAPSADLDALARVVAEGLQQETYIDAIARRQRTSPPAEQPAPTEEPASPAPLPGGRS